MLNLVRSNRMEHLVKALCACLEQVPGDPMAPEWIGIQSRGMKQWLTASIARHFGICANIDFLFPRQILERILDKTEQTLPGKRDERPLLSREIISWAVMERLLSTSAWPASLSGPGSPAGYVAEDDTGRKTWQLSRAVARVFDDYQVYRPDMLEAWARPGAWEREDIASGAGWQAWLWQHLVTEGKPLLAGLDRLISNCGETGIGRIPGLPRRIYLFGVSTMPPRFLEAFNALAPVVDVFAFVMTPSDQFFYDLGSERQEQKRALEQGEEEAEWLEDPETGSPLLRALGKSGREFHGILEHFDYHEPFGELFEDPGVSCPEGQEPSMLQVLQSDIQNLAGRGRGEAHPALPAAGQDRSVTLHACHSPMREAQVLKDQILDIFDRCEEVAPHDIVVMMPDIESYAPFLEAVFSQEPRLPFTVSDRRKRSESRTIEAFLNILGLRGGRLERSKVMDLAISPVVAGKFDLSPEDLEGIDQALDRARIYWGKDREHREQLTSMGFEENTWAFGLTRLLMGSALPAGEDCLAGSVLPCDAFEGLEAQVLGRFVQFTQVLFRSLESLEAPRTLTDWGRCLRRIILSMMADEPGQDDIAFLLTSVDELCREGVEGAGDLKIGFPVLEEALLDKLDQTVSLGSFMAGSITLCNLMPMRSIPFKVVCLMGMDSQSFPRQNREPGFNLMARNPRPGDKQIREEDCYLFLEALLSARSRLLITYTGMSISDNAPIPCAGPVDILKDTMARSFIFPDGNPPDGNPPDGFEWEFRHPLHPFSPAYFDGSRPGLFSFSRSLCDIAAAQAERRAGKAGPLSLALDRRETTDVDPEAAAVDIDTLIRFFRRPAETFVRESVGVAFPRVDEASRDRECFQVSGLDRYSLGTDCLASPGDPALLVLARTGGRLPLGRKGDLEWEQVRSLSDSISALADEIFPHGEPGHLDIRISAEGLLFRGRVPDFFSSGRYVKTFGRLSPDRLLIQWIYHLFYCAVQTDAGETWLAGQDGSVKAVGFTPMDNAEAQAHIAVLAALYTRGMAGGLPFACSPCFHLVESLAKQGFDLDDGALEAAAKKARPFWVGSYHGSYQLTGEIQDRYTALAFGDSDPFADAAALRASGFLDTGLAVFRPMMERRLENRQERRGA